MPRLDDVNLLRALMASFILFLDFDGVLHPRTSGTCRHAPLLEEFLRQHADVHVVISSTWRLQYPLDELKGWFALDVQDRFIDVTPELPAGAGSRQREIEQWLRGQPGLRWAALDDEVMLFRAGCPHLVRTDTSTGLTREDLAALARHVGGQA